MKVFYISLDEISKKEMQGFMSMTYCRGMIICTMYMYIQIGIYGNEKL